jgi:hypothetical protein
LDKLTESHRKDIELGDSKRIDKPIRFMPKKHVYWDDRGHFRKVFSKGDICKGTLYPCREVVAESPYYEGIF